MRLPLTIIKLQTSIRSVTHKRRKIQLFLHFLIIVLLVFFLWACFFIFVLFSFLWCSKSVLFLVASRFFETFLVKKINFWSRLGGLFFLCYFCSCLCIFVFVWSCFLSLRPWVALALVAPALAFVFERPIR